MFLEPFPHPATFLRAVLVDAVAQARTNDKSFETFDDSHTRLLWLSIRKRYHSVDGRQYCTRYASFDDLISQGRRSVSKTPDTESRQAVVPREASTHIGVYGDTRLRIVDDFMTPPTTTQNAVGSFENIEARGGYSDSHRLSVRA